MRLIKLLATVATGIFLGLFGSSILTNVHLKYLRILSRNTVLMHNTEGAGASGFIVRGRSGKKYVMTNNHVCELEETLNDGRSGIYVVYQGNEYFLKVIKHYENNDLCAVEAPKTAVLPAMIAYNVSLGESAYAVGHPQLEPLSISIGELSDYVIISIMTGRNVDPNKCDGKGYDLLTLENGKLNPIVLFFGIYNMCMRTVTANSSSIIISPGNSGSPVVNIFGSVIGVVFAANEHGTRSYVVPLFDLKKFLGEL